MSSGTKSILYIRLPCWKIYPGGVIYVANHIHRRHPEIRQHLLDFAIVKPADRERVLREHLESMRPDIVAFSWRNMQSFGPNSDNDALGVALNIDYSFNPLRRLMAALGGLRIIYDYTANRLHNFGYMKLVRRLLPKTRIVVGGGAVSIFGKYVAAKCPTGTMVVIGEGEDTMLSLVEGLKNPIGDFFYKDGSGKVERHTRAETFDLGEQTAIDFAYIESIFPDFHQYFDEYVGVNTKRGCPLKCSFCLYNSIEGARQRYRSPANVADEVEILNRKYGVKNIWFTDAQFCSTGKSTRHMEEILDEILARKLSINWTGYLRLNHLTPELARKMIASGISSIDLSFTGSQEIIDVLTMGYELEQQMEALSMFKAGGFTNQKIKLYIPMNAPGETVETLRMTIDKIKELYALFGRDNVLPFVFFIGIQPGTPIEQMLIHNGYLKADYNPLTLNPFLIKKLLYNPKPLGPIIGRAYLEALKSIDAGSDYVGRATMDILEKELAKSFPRALGQNRRTERKESGGGEERRKRIEGLL